MPNGLVRRVCLPICLASIAFSALMAVLMIWELIEKEETAAKILATSCIVVLASALAIAAAHTGVRTGDDPGRRP